MKDGDLIEMCAQNLISQWERWSADAGQCAQQEQDPDAYTQTMMIHIIPVLQELVLQSRR